MKELKFFVFACDSDNPNDIVNFLKDKSGFILGIKLSDLALVRCRSNYIVVQSNLDKFKLWDRLTYEDIVKLKRSYKFVDVINTEEYISQIAKIDMDNDKFDRLDRIKPLFPTKYCVRFDRTNLTDQGIERYLDSIHTIINSYESGVGTIENLVSLANKQKFMNGINKCKYLPNDPYNVSPYRGLKLDYKGMRKTGVHTVFGNSLIGFIIKDNKELELAYCTLSIERKGEFDHHPLIKMLNSGFYLPKYS